MKGSQYDPYYDVNKSGFNRLVDVDDDENYAEEGSEGNLEGSETPFVGNHGIKAVRNLKRLR